MSFHSTLREGSDDTTGLEELAKLRDKLFHAAIRVYNTVSIVEVIYNLYPIATSRDCQLLKTVLMS